MLGTISTGEYLRRIGVAPLGPRTSPFDPGLDPATVASHLDQSAHLISVLKVSMAGWLVANEASTRAKLAAARSHGVKTAAGGGPFEVAAAQGALEAYLDLCAGFGFDRIECGAGFTNVPVVPREVVRMATRRGLEVHFELGEKHGGAFPPDALDRLIAQGRRWLDAGAVEIVVEARESAAGVGLFAADGGFNEAAADRLARAFGIDRVTFEAPTKVSQFAFLDHFGADVRLANVPLPELLRVEIYRRGLHADAFAVPHLRPGASDAAPA